MSVLGEASRDLRLTGLRTSSSSSTSMLFSLEPVAGFSPVGQAPYGASSLPREPSPPSAVAREYKDKVRIFEAHIFNIVLIECLYKKKLFLRILEINALKTQFNGLGTL